MVISEAEANSQTKLPQSNMVVSILPGIMLRCRATGYDMILNRHMFLKAKQMSACREKHISMRKNIFKNVAE